MLPATDTNDERESLLLRPLIRDESRCQGV